MTSLIETIQSYLTSSVLSAAASHLGESEDGVAKASKGLVATLLAGVLGKTGDAAGLGQIFGMLNDKNNHAFLDNLPGLIGGGNLAHGDPKDVAGRLVGSLFGDKTGGLLQTITSLAGLKAGSASSLLGLAGPLVMGVLGKQIATKNLTADGFKQFMAAEAPAIRGALPAGVGSMLGLGDMAASAMKSATMGATATGAAATAAAAAAATTARKGAPAWMWLVPLALAAVVAWFLLRGKPKAPPVATNIEQPAAPAVEAPAAIEQPAAAVAEFVRKIGAGFELKGAPGGFEVRLIGFIDSGNEPCTVAACWVSCDRLTFKTGSAELDMAQSSDQINNIAEILKAYPGIQLKIGGYTDNTGSEDANMKLSAERADAVIKAVTALGIEPSRLVGEGYGSQFPRASNDTEEGRAMNRRIDVRVRAR
ncbi:MAG: DUF937 domain-containing protein [Parvularculaceae bacterium]|nr:DUF937 domain-containing protein [Parvularculaceae bacterium]